MTLRSLLISSLLLSGCTFGTARSTPQENTALVGCPAELDFVASIPEQWGHARGIVVSISDADAIAGEFCSAAKAAMIDRVGTQAEISSHAALVIDDYMDRMVARDRPGRTLSASLRAALGMPGFARPSIKQWGLIDLTSVHMIDRLYLNGQPFAPATRYLFRVGQVRYRGVQANNDICHGQRSVLANATVAIKC